MIITKTNFTVKFLLGEGPFLPLLLQLNIDSVYMFVACMELIYHHWIGIGHDHIFQVMGWSC